MPMREHLRLSPRLGRLAMLKIELTGLDPDAASKYRPSYPAV
jgi:hypothetical protein